MDSLVSERKIFFLHNILHYYGIDKIKASQGWFKTPSTGGTSCCSDVKLRVGPSGDGIHMASPWGDKGHFPLARGHRAPPGPDAPQ